MSVYKYDPETQTEIEIADTSHSMKVDGSNAEEIVRFPDSTFVSGKNTKADDTTNKYSHAEGYADTADSIIASGDGAHAEGRASGTYKITASGTGSHAEGYANNGSITASGNGSHAEGNGTSASGSYSHAEGYRTSASKAYSHSGGNQGSTGNMYKLNNKTSSNANEVRFAFGTDVAHSSKGSPSYLADQSSYNAFSIANGGSVFTLGERTLARGTVNVLAADGPQIILEDGALYMLYCNGRTTATGAWRGAISYLIEATFNPLGTGTSTTAQAVPHIATCGTTGTVPVKLDALVESYTKDGATRYHSKLGIGSCTTAITTRWNLVKVLGSEADFAT